VSAKALAAAETARLPRSYWRWADMLASNQTGFFPYTPGTNLLYGLRESIHMLLEEGLDNVFRRHDRHAEATRRAVRAWGLEVLCANPAEYSSSLTAVMLPEGHDEAALRRIALARFDLSLGQGLGKVKGRVFRIGHLGDFNDLMLCGTLAGVEMGLELAGVPHQQGGVAAAMTYLASTAGAAATPEAAPARAAKVA
jgi:alanine-glyoxylate transaminase / serine-glyoxylate transaminase / serine-pyruvate transaminase